VSSVESRRRRLTQVVVWTVVTAAAGVLVVAVPETIRFLDEAPGGFWAMALAALLVDVPLFGATSREDLRVRSTLSVCFTFAIFVLWGAAPAVVVQALAGAVTVVGQRYDPASGVFLVARLILAVAAAELVVDVVDPRPITRPGTGLNGGDLLAIVLLAAVWFAVSYGLLLVVSAAARRHGWRQGMADTRADLFTTIVAVLVVAPLLTTLQGWVALLIGAPLLLVNMFARSQMRHEQQLTREPVTGLLNRQGLAQGLQALTALDLITPQGPRPFGIILVNFESVMEINRTLGRELYEQVVGVASQRLIDAYGGDRAARVSGEGIVILMPDLTESDAIAETEAAVSLLEPLIEVEDIPFALDPAGGVALSPQHGRDLGALLMKAEIAAGEARRRRRRAVLYVHRAAELAVRRIMLLRELHTVLRSRARHHEITVLYQPQVDLNTGQLVAVEALLRWTHPEWGPIPTDELIESIEPSEIMHRLTWHVLDSVAGQMHRWNERGEQLRVSVNVSVQDLHRPNFVDDVGALVRRHGIAPHQLVLEITERLLISDVERVSDVARVLAQQGVGLSLDDFGTGHASLQQLRELPLDEVKVDRTYVRGMVDNPADAAIVTSVHQLTRALGVTVVAEGVEDERIANALARLPGTIGQGWYLGRPMSVDDLQGWRQSRQAHR
jgi:EAL domain-containing protein (putative c-di-GMP-specific phosphodiesterase class I)/GGDEF domain-containing protein